MRIRQLETSRRSLGASAGLLMEKGRRISQIELDRKRIAKNDLHQDTDAGKVGESEADALALL